MKKKLSQKTQAAYDNLCCRINGALATFGEQILIKHGDPEGSQEEHITKAVMDALLLYCKEGGVNAHFVFDPHYGDIYCVFENAINVNKNLLLRRRRRLLRR